MVLIKSLSRSLLLAPVLFSVVFGLVSCGGGGGSTGAGQEDSNRLVPNTTEPVIGPNLNGDNWVGHFRLLDGSQFTGLTAVIRQVGADIIIETTKTEIAHLLDGFIDGSGNMIMIDQFDGEDWTTLFGPATTNSINLADFVFINGVKVQTNLLVLKR